MDCVQTLEDRQQGQSSFSKEAVTAAKVDAKSRLFERSLESSSQPEYSEESSESPS
jgi:hypothetical protein